MPRPLALLAGISIAFPLVQLIPLPYPVWTALPGREPIAQTFELLGLKEHWFPMSMSPARTFIAFLSLIPALTMMMLAACLDETWRSRVLWAIAALGVMNVALGAMQLAAGNSVADVFEGGNSARLDHGAVRHFAFLVDQGHDRGHSRLTLGYGLGRIIFAAKQRNYWAIESRPAPQCGLPFGRGIPMIGQARPAFRDR